jgi:hypothetical protein
LAETIEPRTNSQEARGPVRDASRSIEIPSAEAQDQLAAERSHFEALDTKAGVLLGFSGLLAALTPENPSWWAAGARLTGIASAALALAVFVPRDYPLVDIRRFRNTHVAADPALTRLILLDNHLLALDRAEALSDQKSRRLRASIAMLFIAIMSTTLGLLAGP